MNRKFATALATFLTAAALLPLAAAAQFTKPTLLSPDPKIRHLASRQVRPIYPPSAAKSKITGPAVAHILVEPNGHVAKITLLQAPDAAIGRAMVAALRQWSFPVLPLAEGRKYQHQGTVVYYFLIQAGKPVVLSPAEAPIIGPHQATPPGGSA